MMIRRGGSNASERKRDRGKREAGGDDTTGPMTKQEYRLRP